MADGLFYNDLLEPHFTSTSFEAALTTDYTSLVGPGIVSELPANYFIRSGKRLRLRATCVVTAVGSNPEDPPLTLDLAICVGGKRLAVARVPYAGEDLSPSMIWVLDVSIVSYQQFSLIVNGSLVSNYGSRAVPVASYSGEDTEALDSDPFITPLPIDLRMKSNVANRFSTCLLDFELISMN